MVGGAFAEGSLSIRGWSLGAEVNAFPLAALGDDEGWALVAQGLSFSPVGETGEGLDCADTEYS
jgi:hypothetical protein